LMVRKVSAGLPEQRMALQPGKALVVDAAAGQLYRIEDPARAVVAAQDARREGSDLVIVLAQGIEVRMRQFFARKPHPSRQGTAESDEASDALAGLQLGDTAGNTSAVHFALIVDGMTVL